MWYTGFFSWGLFFYNQQTMWLLGHSASEGEGGGGGGGFPSRTTDTLLFDTLFDSSMNQ